MAEIEVSKGIIDTLGKMPPGAFSTYDFIVEYQALRPGEWQALEDAYGVGGKGAGRHSTAFTRVAQTLNKLASEGELKKLDYGDAPSVWGNPIIRYWTRDSDETIPVEPPAIDDEFREGAPLLKHHLRRERHWGLARKKKAQFIARHGKLFCEHCKLDPGAAFGLPLGEAVIEVHHARVMVGEMGKDHKTKLGDLECLCANCHRLAHARISAGGR